MTPEQRARASVDLTLTYFDSYYQDWRLAKVLMLKKMLAQRYEYCKDFIEDIKHGRDENGDATIAQELRNGLYFDAIAQCVQYVEDLFAFINAAKKPDFFVRDIISYDAGKVTALIRSFKTDKKNIGGAFRFPYDMIFTSDDYRAQYDHAAGYLESLVISIINFYKDYQHFYYQYKHGLAVAMRPFGNVYNQEQIDSDKAGNFKPYLRVYDNLNLSTAEKKGTLRTGDAIMMTGFTENVRPFINDLAKENNFIRLEQPKDPDLNIDYLVDMAYKVRACLNTFICNYSDKIRVENKSLTFQLPVNHRTRESIIVNYNVEDQIISE